MKRAVRTVAVVAVFVALIAASGCSREQQDWRSAQAADTIEAYDQFVTKHADSARAAQAKDRVLQLSEDRDWRRASSADNVDAYRQFLSEHPSGKWAPEARIRVENFALAGSPGAPASPAPAATPGALPPAPAEPPPGRVNSPPPESKAAASPPPVAAVAPPATGKAIAGYGIQLGAFATKVRAERQWHRLTTRFQAELHGLAPRILPMHTSRGRLYRLQAAVANGERAHSICGALKKHSQSCLVVSPHAH